VNSERKCRLFLEGGYPCCSIVLVPSLVAIFTSLANRASIHTTSRARSFPSMTVVSAGKSPPKWVGPVFDCWILLLLAGQQAGVFLQLI
jgi:hypothetical protein